MITTVKFAKIKENAIIPTKNDEDAGYDIYPCFNEDWMIIYPHQTVMIPTGICSAFDSDYVMVLKERGSLGSKGIGLRAGIIDSGYRGEYFVALTNHNDDRIMIISKDEKESLNYIRQSFCYMKLSHNGLNRVDDTIIYPYNKAICQALLLPVPKVVTEEYTYDEIQAIPSKRGTGKLGSSGK